MVRIEPFEVEQWMDKYEEQAKYNIAETCCASISLSDLSALSSAKSDGTPLSLLPSDQKLTYGAIRGSQALRSQIAALYPRPPKRPGPVTLVTKDTIITTPGAIAANFLVFLSLIEKGDRVVCQYPTYSQLYQVPRAFGAEIELWKPKRSAYTFGAIRPEKTADGEGDWDWKWDVEDLKFLLRKGQGMKTKMIVLNNPNNPTGAVLEKDQLEAIIEVASSHGAAQGSSITILSDEVYRPIFHSCKKPPPSLLQLPLENSSFAPHLIATGSLSKAFSLAGIRIGWIASRSSAMIDTLAETRNYTAISVSQLDEAVAAFALDPRVKKPLVARNERLARTNANLLAQFVDLYSHICSWSGRCAGTTAFVKFCRTDDATGKSLPVDDVILARTLVERYGVLVVPGSICFEDVVAGRRERDFAGYVRIGFACETEVLTVGLEKIMTFLSGKGGNGAGGVADVPFSGEQLRA